MFIYIFKNNLIFPLVTISFIILKNTSEAFVWKYSHMKHFVILNNVPHPPAFQCTETAFFKEHTLIPTPHILHTLSANIFLGGFQKDKWRYWLSSDFSGKNVIFLVTCLTCLVFVLCSRSCFYRAIFLVAN